jgi:hypothetical protein
MGRVVREEGEREAELAGADGAVGDVEERGAVVDAEGLS